MVCQNYLFVWKSIWCCLKFCTKISMKNECLAFIICYPITCDLWWLNLDNIRNVNCVKIVLQQTLCGNNSKAAISSSTSGVMVSKERGDTYGAVSKGRGYKRLEHLIHGFYENDCHFHRTHNDLFHYHIHKVLILFFTPFPPEKKI